ncbi:hypothetical protein HK103_003756 [Boothiomyces macroporosus]|uniref:Peptidase M20 dimerisation domain-containing protein n=1 Tax=Boothiomyces macroporosus TaxID=261099 RepID=A0AAD5UIA2_9FUNG|nr:hypothetical protein HK103_003756 [Boothiomyces macroporosus]
MEKQSLLGGRKKTSKRWTFLGIFVPLLLIGTLLLTYWPDLNKVSLDDECVQEPSYVPTGERAAELNQRYEEYLTSSGFADSAAKRFSGAIKIPTVSYDEMTAQVPQDPVSHKPFLEFHKYLEKSYPLVHQRLEKHVVNEYSLVFYWKGSDISLKPTMLMAHIDVVPVDPATANEWKYPPFSGEIADGKVWGRGTADTKMSLIGILESVEALLEVNYEPKRSVIVAFGHDEEITGFNGAQNIVKFIENNLAIPHHGVEMILDEGMTLAIVEDPKIGVMKQREITFANIGIAEKGYVNVNISVSMDIGGHASIAPQHTGIGILSQVIVALENNPFAPDLEESNPILKSLNCQAAHTNKFSKREKYILKHWKAFKHVLLKVFSANPALNAAVTTSQAIDVIQGGVKVNALPQFSFEVANHRIALHETVDTTLDHIYSLVRPIAKKNNLDFLPTPDTPRTKGTKGAISVNHLGFNPSPISPTDASPYKVLSSVIRRVFPDSIVAPSLMTANTDTRWVWNLSESIFRFVPDISTGDEGIHTVNENNSIENLVGIARFYHELIRAFDE